VKSFEFAQPGDHSQGELRLEQAAREDEKNRDHIQKAHRNFLRDAVYFLYMYNRPADAAEWYRYLATQYPDKPLITGDTNSLPAR